VHEKRRDGFVQRAHAVLRIFVDEDGDRPLLSMNLLIP
jgi:hypothetical protein